jgi:transposase
MLKYSKISKYKVKKILMLFSEDITAVKAASILKLNRKTIDRYYNLFREKIMQVSIREMEVISGEIELDESYFGAKRVRGKRERGAAGKTPVFGLLKRDGKVFVTVVKNCSKAELMPIIKGHILEGSTIHTDGWKAYDGLILNGYDHYRVHHSNNEFARGKNHVNGIESFWSFAKRRLAKFNGIASQKFHVYLKECEFRFNYRNCDIYAKMLEVIRLNS